MCTPIETQELANCQTWKGKRTIAVARPKKKHQKYHHALNKMMPGFLHRKWTFVWYSNHGYSAYPDKLHGFRYNPLTESERIDDVVVSINSACSSRAHTSQACTISYLILPKFTSIIQVYPAVHTSYPLLCYAFRGPSTPGNLTILALFHLRRVQRFPSGKHRWFSSQVTTTSEGPPGWKFFLRTSRRFKKKSENTRWKGSMDLKNGTKDHWSGYDGYVWSHDLQSGLWIDFFGTLYQVMYFGARVYGCNIPNDANICSKATCLSLSLSLFGVLCTVLVASCIFQDMIGYGKEPF